MNETTAVLFNLLVSENGEEMTMMLKSTDSMEAFADLIETYIRGPLIDEVDFARLAQEWAELPF